MTMLVAGVAVIVIVIAAVALFMQSKRGKKAKTTGAEKGDLLTTNVVSAKAFCIECGKELPSDSKFCRECGAKQP
jgi:membrane protease subunit (stomatin/prohibitin family)